MEGRAGYPIRPFVFEVSCGSQALQMPYGIDEHHAAARLIWRPSREEEKIYLAGVEPPRDRAPKAWRSARTEDRPSRATVARPS